MSGLDNRAAPQDNRAGWSCPWHFQISMSMSVSLDCYRASVDHGMWYIFQKLWPTDFDLLKVYFPKVCFPKVYFSKVCFPKVYFSVSMSVSLDCYRASVDHGMWYIFQKLWPTDFDLFKVYFPKVCFPKVYFSKVCFPKVYFSTLYFSNVYFVKLYFWREPIFY